MMRFHLLLSPADTKRLAARPARLPELDTWERRYASAPAPPDPALSAYTPGIGTVCHVMRKEYLRQIIETVRRRPQFVCDPGKKGLAMTHRILLNCKGIWRHHSEVRASLNLLNPAFGYCAGVENPYPEQMDPDRVKRWLPERNLCLSVKLYQETEQIDMYMHRDRMIDGIIIDAPLGDLECSLLRQAAHHGLGAIVRIRKT